MENKKIIITGGLGYVGTELCKLYSGFARTNNIIVLDNRFFSKRVKQLRDWGIEYVQGDIMDESLLQNLLPGADIIHHLAGITDVAYTKTDASDEKDKQIINVGIQGSKNIIKHAPADCKIVFPSTHVVFEGLLDTTFDIDENAQTVPVLTYSKGKVQTENDLIESNKNYVILRLGSNYGLSEDNMRINIMPNLFSKFTSQNSTLRLFSKGVQYKSLVAVQDVARCLKFVSEDDSISKQIYNCTNENMSVKDVALLCQKYNPSLNIVETDDEVPNLGYTLSNKKILSTGFKFLYNIEESIKEMIYEWSTKDISKEIEYVVRGTNNYVDSRGIISNYELSEPINLIGYIESKANTIRANHYHPVQEQKVLLIKGEYISVCQDLLIPNSPKITKLIKEGDLIVTRPNVAHTMVFTKDSVLLNLVNGERKHENYGITHTVSYPIVTEEEKSLLISSYKKKCRSCNSSELKRFVSLGWSPLANNLIDSPEEKIETFPLEVDFCENCFNCQLSVVVQPEKMFDNYLYKSSIGKSFVKHFEDAAEKYIKDFKLNENSLVIDIGSNDGISLVPFKKNGIKVLGIEPARNIAKEATEKGIDTINGYFESPSTLSLIKQKYVSADIITASNVFAHSDELKTMIKSIIGYNLLKCEGQFIVEVQYLYDTINDLTFDNIYHEHVNYWSVSSFKKFVDGINYYSGNRFALTKVEHIDTHGGSIRLYMTLYNPNTEKVVVDNSVCDFLLKENDLGMTNLNVYTQFGEKVEKIKEKVNKNFSILQKQFKNICGYGAPAKATTALNFFGINSEKVKYVIEDNILKHNKYIPGVNIPIYSKEKLKTDSPDLVIVMAWNFFDDIVKNNKHLFSDNTVFLSIKDLECENILNKIQPVSVS